MIRQKPRRNLLTTRKHNAQHRGGHTRENDVFLGLYSTKKECFGIHACFLVPQWLLSWLHFVPCHNSWSPDSAVLTWSYMSKFDICECQAPGCFLSLLLGQLCYWHTSGHRVNSDDNLTRHKIIGCLLSLDRKVENRGKNIPLLLCVPRVSPQMSYPRAFDIRKCRGRHSSSHSSPQLFYRVMEMLLYKTLQNPSKEPPTVAWVLASCLICCLHHYSLHPEVHPHHSVEGFSKSIKWTHKSSLWSLHLSLRNLTTTHSFWKSDLIEASEAWTVRLMVLWSLLFVDFLNDVYILSILTNCHMFVKIWFYFDTK